jgi:hypothetical protein
MSLVFTILVIIGVASIVGAASELFDAWMKGDL